MATERIRYVDTDVVGGAGNGTSWANAYATLAAMEDGEDGNLVTADVWLHVYARGTAADAAACVWAGWTTDATRYIYVECVAGHRATASGWKTDRYRLSVANTDSMQLTAGCEFLTLDGMQIECIGDGNGDDTFYMAGMVGDSLIQLLNCRVRNSVASGRTSLLLQAADADINLRCWNTIFEAHPSNAGTLDGLYCLVETADFYNCIIYGTRRGIRDAGGVVRIYDSVSFNNIDDFYGGEDVVDYCASDDNDGTNNVAEGTTGGAAWPNIFEDAANGDFRLKAGVALIGAGGRAGSTYFSTDIEGTTRGAAWDLGPYEYVAAGGATNVVCMLFDS